MKLLKFNKGFNRSLVAALFGFALTVGATQIPAQAKEPQVKDILNTYADIAHATYEDSLISAEAMSNAIKQFLANPSDDTLLAARKAWIKARAPYQQTEAYRFGNSIVDDWEGKVNAWPLDEGLIDYVKADYYGSDSDENKLYVANIIANKQLQISGKKIDASIITKTLLADTLHEAENIEANVATGYHAIEFLLWGQDTNGTGKGAGNRPASDFDLVNCTNGNCDRRRDYLSVATELLIDDLKWMVTQWTKDGAARKALLEGNESTGLTTIFTGMGSLSYGELAGERIKLGLILNDPEEEHDCFSDNTHYSHYYDVVGIQNVYLGVYKRIDGSVIQGSSLSQLVAARNAEADTELRARISETLTALSDMVRRAHKVESYDQMLGEGNKEGNAVVQNVVDRLVVQTKAIERAVAALDLKAIPFEGSDSLDNPSKVNSE